MTRTIKQALPFNTTDRKLQRFESLAMLNRIGETYDIPIPNR